MHPNALLELSTDLIHKVMQFDTPADRVVSDFFRFHRALGPRERNTLAETTYTVLRQRLLYQHLAQSGKGEMERRLALLGWQGNAAFLRAALTEPELHWMEQVATIDRATLPDKLRHNLPEWLADLLQAELGDEFWPLVNSLNAPAGLDLRVNAFKAKREDVQAALKAGGLLSEITPYSPLGLRLQGKPALNKLDSFTRGDVEVQDEGSQLLALLVDAKRGEMVADFCAGAGGKLWPWARPCATLDVCTRSTRLVTAWRRSSRAWRAAGFPTSTQRKLRMNVTTASSACLASSTACWWTRRAQAWAP